MWKSFWMLPPPPTFRAAELGNWNAGPVPKLPPSLIRNFSGPMDEFALFNRAWSGEDIHRIYWEGDPQAGTEPADSRRRP